jgi:hypothetical protein
MDTIPKSVKIKSMIGGRLIVNLMDKLNKIARDKGISLKGEETYPEAENEVTATKMDTFDPADDEVIVPNFDDEVVASEVVSSDVELEDEVIASPESEQEDQVDSQQAPQQEPENFGQEPQQNPQHEPEEDLVATETIRDGNNMNNTTKSNLTQESTAIVDRSSFVDQVSVESKVSLVVGGGNLAEFERKAFLTNVIGSSEEVNVISIAGDPGVELTPEPVEDRSGRISDIIEKFQGELPNRIVPSEITNIPDFVTPSRHSYFTDRGKRHFFPKGTSDQIVSQLKEEFLEKLRVGDFVSYDFSKVITYKGRPLTLYLLTPAEVKTLATMFKAYGPKLVESAGEGGFKILKLVIGDYIYG